MDYAKMAQTALRLIEANGRVVDVVRIQRQPADPAKPWRGPNTPRVEDGSETEDVDKITVLASFVEPSSLVRFGFKSEELDGTRRVEEVALIAAASLGGRDLTDFDEINDGAVAYKIELIRRIAPADVALLYMVGIRR